MGLDEGSISGSVFGVKFQAEPHADGLWWALALIPGYGEVVLDKLSDRAVAEAFCAQLVAGDLDLTIRDHGITLIRPGDEVRWDDYPLFAKVSAADLPDLRVLSIVASESEWFILSKRGWREVDSLDIDGSIGMGSPVSIEEMLARFGREEFRTILSYASARSRASVPLRPPRVGVVGRPVSNRLGLDKDQQGVIATKLELSTRTIGRYLSLTEDHEPALTVAFNIAMFCFERWGMDPMKVVLCLIRNEETRAAFEAWDASLIA